jgi:hypothetical protein
MINPDVAKTLMDAAAGSAIYISDMAADIAPVVNNYLTPSAIYAALFWMASYLCEKVVGSTEYEESPLFSWYISRFSQVSLIHFIIYLLYCN